MFLQIFMCKLGQVLFCQPIGLYFFSFDIVLSYDFKRQCYGYKTDKTLVKASFV